MNNTRLTIVMGMFVVMFFMELIWVMPGNVVTIEKYVIKKVMGVTTAYGMEDSCHYEGCPNASGKIPTEGTIACPRDIKLGTRVRITGKEYVCEDRYAKYLDGVRKLPTFDIFMLKGAAEFGKHIVEVEVITEK